MKNIKVMLKTNLTRYARGLVAGSIGYTTGRNGEFSRYDDKFITVDFPGIATLDILWSSLEILDEEILLRMAKEEDYITDNIRKIQKADLFMGPLGGFRYLLIVIDNSEHRITDRERALRIYKKMSKANLLIDKHYN